MHWSTQSNVSFGIYPEVFYVPARNVTQDAHTDHKIWSPLENVLWKYAGLIYCSHSQLMLLCGVHRRE